MAQEHISRRGFVAVGCTSVALVGFGGFGAITKQASASYVRPPGNASQEDLIARCDRCQRCLQVCPYNIITPVPLGENLIGYGTPTLDFTHGYCDFCMLCTLCPVGFLQVALASRSIPWGLLPWVIAALFVVFLLGRVFCSWLCPTSLLKNAFGGRTPRGLTGQTGEEEKVLEKKSCATCSSGEGFKTQAIILAALLVVSFIVRFPVFCLFCPIGLVFGTVWAVNRVFVLLQPGWELIIFPLMLIAEIFLFKRWCSAICPLGFFFTVMAKVRTRLGFGVKPKTDCGTCISREGCKTCSTVCPENIDVVSADLKDLEPCTLCLDCIENCPTKSISVSIKNQSP